MPCLSQRWLPLWVRGDARNEPERVWTVRPSLGPAISEPLPLEQPDGYGVDETELRRYVVYCFCAWNSVRAGLAVTVSRSLPGIVTCLPR